ncbi:MAG: hypothetical protein OEY64_06085 [Nitrospinota bacterium]|nr:hypothetical protein [Nitrospinota bacterium]
MGNILNWCRARVWLYKAYKLQRVIHPSLTKETFHSLFSGKKEKALEEYFDLCFENSEIKKILKKHDIGKDFLLELYPWLLKSGAWQWVQGEHAALSVFIHPELLDFCINSFVTGKPPIMETSWKIIQFIENGRRF